MPNSWFTKGNDPKEANSEPINQGNETLQLLLTKVDNPHDDVLGQLHSTDVGPSSREGAEDSATPANPRQNSNTPNIKAFDTIYDPYDGFSLGHRSGPFSDSKTGNDNGAKNEELWSHLSRLLELQNEVAKLHMDMEGVGARTGDMKGKAKAKGPLRDKTPLQTLQPIFSDRKFSMGSAGDVIYNDVDEPVDGDPDGEEERARTRQQAFAKLADQFDRRKETIQEIMLKLDDLSGVLTDFHALQAPKIDFSSTSRGNSLGASPETTPTHVAFPPAQAIGASPAVPSSASILPASLSRISGKKPALAPPIDPPEQGTSRHMPEGHADPKGGTL